MRETLFNWLQQDIRGARCLDLFAGSGALGLEALSRGAAEVLMCDCNAAVVQQLQANLATLAAEGCEVHQITALGLLEQKAGQAPFDIVFLDPPFGQGLLAPCIRQLESGAWLTENAKIYLEAESDLENLELPDNWQLLREKTTGQISYRLVQRSSP